MAGPTPPIAFAGGHEVQARLASPAVEVPDALVQNLRETGAEVTLDAGARAEASRDWWPLAMGWALADQVAGLAGVVVRPSEPAQVAEVLRGCHEYRVPVTPAGGRSGVC